MKVFLDTNVIIDFYAQRDEFFRPAAVIMDLAIKKQLELCVSSLSFVNAFYVLGRTYKVEDLYGKLCFLSNLCSITSIGGEDIRYGLNNRSLDFEDTVQYISAKSIRPDVIITRNIKHFKGIDVMVKTPIEFLDGFFSTVVCSRI